MRTGLRPAPTREDWLNLKLTEFVQFVGGTRGSGSDREKEVDRKQGKESSWQCTEINRTKSVLLGTAPTQCAGAEQCTDVNLIQNINHPPLLS